MQSSLLQSFDISGDVFGGVRQILIDAATAAFSLAGDHPALQKITVEWPREGGGGDIACNAAMVLAGTIRQKPRDVAETLKASLTTSPFFSSINVAGPGFINITLQPAVWEAELRTANSKGAGYGINRHPSSPVNIEYVSANPTGPLHVGHVRSAIVGDVIASLLQRSGTQVTREYYVNDAGAQIDTLAWSLHHRYREACGEPAGSIAEGLYPGEYLIPAAQKLASPWYYGAAHQHDDSSAWLDDFRQQGIREMLDMIAIDLQLLGIRFDLYQSEKALALSGTVLPGSACEPAQSLEQQGYLAMGVLEPPKGKKPDDWEEKEQWLFLSKDKGHFGDDSNRVVMKADGTLTYFAGDILHFHHLINEKGFTNLIIVLGADHAGYVNRLKNLVHALSGGKASIDVKVCQLVNLIKEGQPYKMSKRAGTFVTAREVIDEIGKNALRFMMLARKNDVPFDFDLDKVKEQNRDNPVFYVNYAYARCQSVLRRAAEEHPATPFGKAALQALEHDNTDTLAAADLTPLTHEAELLMIRQLAYWPRVFAAAATHHEPHRLCQYTQDVAQAFHRLWNEGKDNTELRFIDPADERGTMARLALVTAVQRVLLLVLGIMGVEPQKEM